MGARASLGVILLMAIAGAASVSGQSADHDLDQEPDEPAAARPVGGATQGPGSGVRPDPPAPSRGVSSPPTAEEIRPAILQKFDALREETPSRGFRRRGRPAPRFWAGRQRFPQRVLSSSGGPTPFPLPRPRTEPAKIPSPAPVSPAKTPQVSAPLADEKREAELLPLPRVRADAKHTSPTTVTTTGGPLLPANHLAAITLAEELLATDPENGGARSALKTGYRKLFELSTLDHATALAGLARKACLPDAAEFLDGVTNVTLRLQPWSEGLKETIRSELSSNVPGGTPPCDGTNPHRQAFERFAEILPAKAAQTGSELNKDRPNKAGGFGFMPPSPSLLWPPLMHSPKELPESEKQDRVPSLKAGSIRAAVGIAFDRWEQATETTLKAIETARPVFELFGASPEEAAKILSDTNSSPERKGSAEIILRGSLDRLVREAFVDGNDKVAKHLGSLLSQRDFLDGISKMTNGPLSPGRGRGLLLLFLTASKMNQDAVLTLPAIRQQRRFELSHSLFVLLKGLNFDERDPDVRRALEPMGSYLSQPWGTSLPHQQWAVNLAQGNLKANLVEMNKNAGDVLNRGVASVPWKNVWAPYDKVIQNTRKANDQFATRVNGKELLGKPFEFAFLTYERAIVDEKRLRTAHASLAKGMAESFDNNVDTAFDLITERFGVPFFPTIMPRPSQILRDLRAPTPDSS